MNLTNQNRTEERERKMTELEIRMVRLPDSLPRCNIYIQDRKIVSINRSARSDNYINAKGYYCIPGVIDPHVHSRFPGQPEKEDWAHVMAAAFYGGVTTICDMPNTDPPLVTAAAVNRKCRLLGDTPLNYRLWFGATSSNEEEINQVAKHPKIVGVKMYMGSSTGGLLVSRERDQRRIFVTCARHNLLLAVHAEDEAMMQSNRKELGDRTLTMLDHGCIRSPAAEIKAVTQALRLAAETHCRLYLCHISTPEAVELAHQAKQQGVNVTVEVCPHHLFLTEEDVRAAQRKGEAGWFKVNPPLRSRQSAEALRQLLRRDDYIDVIGSDHAPHEAWRKHAQTYYNMASGIAGIQTTLPLLLTLVRDNELSLRRLVALTANNPARCLNVSNKGYIRVGYDADLVLFKPHTTSVIRPNDMASKCQNTPWQGRTVFGLPHIVIANGQIVCDRRGNKTS